MTIVSVRILEEKSITITSTAQTLETLGLNATNIKNADIVMITVEADCRFTLGGTIDPTASIGHYLAAQLDREFPGNIPIKNMKLIRVGGSDVAGFITLAKL